MPWEISIPDQLTRGLFHGLETYETREEAVEAAREWGADDDGRVQIINELPDDDL